MRSKTMKVPHKLAVLVSVALLAMALLGFGAWRNYGGLQAKANAVEAAGAARQMEMEADMSHDAIRADVIAAVLIGPTPEGKKSAFDRIKGDGESLLGGLHDAAAATGTKAADDALTVLQTDLDRYVTFATEIIDQAKTDQAGARAKLPEFLDLFRKLEANIPSLSDVIKGDSDRAVAAAADQVRRARLVTLGLTALTALVLVSVAIAITRSVVRPLRRVMDALRQLAAGDLTTRVDAEGTNEFGELGRAFNESSERIQAAVAAIGARAGDLGQSSARLAGVATELASSSAQTSTHAETVSSAATQVATRVEMAYAGTDQIGTSVRNIAASAHEATEVAATAVGVTSRMSVLIEELGEATQQIGHVVGVITDIADMTNLLALNATIEAARAGEAGKGFAVVAGEVKELARQTTTATGKITDTVAAVQERTAAAAAAIGQIVEVANRISESQESISAAVSQQSATASELLHGVSEASHGATSILEVIGDVANAAAVTSDGARAAQGAAHELAGMAAELDDLVSQFIY